MWINLMFLNNRLYCMNLNIADDKLYSNMIYKLKILFLLKNFQNENTGICLH